MLAAASYHSRWDFDRKTLTRDSDRDFLKKDYQMSRLGVGSLIAPNATGMAKNSHLSAKDMPNPNIINRNLEWEEPTITTIECARALDELFRATLPGGAIHAQGPVGGFGSPNSDSRNRYVEVAKPSGPKRHADLFSTGGAGGGAEGEHFDPRNASSSERRQSLSMMSAVDSSSMMMMTSPHNNLKRTSAQRHLTTSRNAEQEKADRERQKMRELYEAQNPSDDQVAQDMMFRLVTQPTSVSMALASTLPRLVRLGTLPTSWALIHARMASGKRVEVQAGSVKMVQ